ncbi:putative amylase, secreted [Guillardia theta CCMP2712]|uniref:Putative amylase, secreted n=1 Tax=Guillardia theta (strain CCMP2712) TaxID=905079 RepID=L1II59_GUITC|nr:putative amylase, secreted [Guillardia theta CCMP2712]EKX35634.1 putative amylase, secreted [Guillardia theta CCMP2712]|eukprot:XP_005822614.1 putative amylase, secreted [Guillardia theta CCMP2712]
MSAIQWLGAPVHIGYASWLQTFVSIALLPVILSTSLKSMVEKRNIYRDTMQRPGLLRLRGGQDRSSLFEPHFMLRVKCANSKWGETVGVVGNSASLGTWSSPMAMRCDGSWPQWRVELPCHQGVDVMEYKFVKMNDHGQIIEWEPVESNRQLLLLSNLEGKSVDDGEYGRVSRMEAIIQEQVRAKEAVYAVDEETQPHANDKDEIFLKRAKKNNDNLKEQDEEEAARKKAKEEEEEAARKKAKEEEEAARKKAKEEEEEAARKKAKEEEEEAARKKAKEEEEEAARKKAKEEEEAARKKAKEEEEAARKKAKEEEEEAARKKAKEEEEAARKKAKEEEEAARKKAKEVSVGEVSSGASLDESARMYSSKQEMSLVTSLSMCIQFASDYFGLVS